MHTITAEYVAEQKALHNNPSYGVASLSFAPIIARLVADNGWTSISDYGAGKKRLKTALSTLGVNITYSAYDPAYPEYGDPTPADLVCCIDVLEHVEPDCLNSVLEQLEGLTTGYGFFSVHCGPAVKFLSDGRNAHLIQEPPSWWLQKLCPHFEIHHLQRHRYMGDGFWVLVGKKSDERLRRLT